MQQPERLLIVAKFDKSKPYGQVSGEHGGAAFEQDGVLFDAQGDELEVGKPAKSKLGGESGAEKPKASRDKPAKSEPVAADPSTDAVDAQLAAQGA